MTMPKTAKILSAAVLLGVISSAAYFFNRHESDAQRQSTDNAYVQADFTLVSPRVAGQISQVLVSDDETVVVGQLLAVIDDRDLQVALSAAQAEVQAANASIDSLKAQRSRQSAVISQAGANLAATQAGLALAQANRQRYQNLAADGSGTVQEAQQANAQERVQQAGQNRDQAAYSAAQLQVTIFDADLKKAQAALARSQAALASAQLNLSYTQITAPMAGTVGRRSVRPGAYTAVGSTLLALVPLDAVYIEAQFRETQLAKVRPGQSVSIEVDTLPGVLLKGHVASLAAASNKAFSPLAPQNATGNFTKVVQRLSVRITLDPDQAAHEQLRVGMSVRPSIDTGTAL